jgi:hypothetical protein
MKAMCQKLTFLNGLNCEAHDLVFVPDLSLQKFKA